MRAWLLVALLVLSAGTRADGLLVVAHPQVPDSTLSIEELASIYLAQRTAWSNGLPVVPVNREAESAIREEFSRKVLERSPRELAAYWNRLRFQGKLPPLIQTSDQAVLGFVRSVPGAIGYISDRQALAGVKIVARMP